MAEERTQARDRLPMNGTDRFGRLYLYSLDLKARDVVGQITTAAAPGQEDPLGTPQKFLSVDRRRPYTVRIDFDGWIREAEEAARDRKRRRLVIKRQMPDLNKEEVEDLLGDQPIDPAHIREAKAGNWKYLTKDGKKPKPVARDADAELEEVLDEPTEEEIDEEPADAGGTAVGSRARGQRTAARS